MLVHWLLSSLSMRMCAHQLEAFGSALRSSSSVTAGRNPFAEATISAVADLVSGTWIPCASHDIAAVCLAAFGSVPRSSSNPHHIHAAAVCRHTQRISSVGATVQQLACHRRVAFVARNVQSRAQCSSPAIL